MNAKVYYFLFVTSLLLVFVLLIALVVVLILRRRKLDSGTGDRAFTEFEIEGDIVNRKQALDDVIGCAGIDTSPTSYTIINDCDGTEYFVRCFTLNSMPNKTTFSITFQSIIKFPQLKTRVFIIPEAEDVTKKKLDKHIDILDGETDSAIKARQRSRARSLRNQLGETEKWVNAIEDGVQKFYNVKFLFVLYNTSLEGLNIASSELYLQAKNKGMDITAAYACHAEAFLSGIPICKPYNAEFGIVKQAPLKTLHLSRGSVADLFEHTDSEFRHKSGVPIGRTLSNGSPIFHSPFDRTHKNGYGIIFAGMTGSGKTTLIKIFAKRLHNTASGYRFAIIDSQRRANRGEYSSLADDLNGVCHVIKHNSPNIINLCEVSVQTEYDENTGKTYEALHLAERKSVIVDHLFVAMQGVSSDEHSSEIEYKHQVWMRRILTDILDKLFAEAEIYDGQPESLYVESKRVDDKGHMVTARVKKKLPTIGRIYREIMLIDHMARPVKYEKLAESNSTQYRSDAYREAVDLMIASLKDYVHCQAYYETDDHALHFVSEDVYAALPYGKGKKKQYLDNGKLYDITAIEGNRDYFDGQSTVEFSTECPCTNFDISALPENERPVARQITLGFITEEFSKNNATNFNSDTSDKLVIILDENQENYKLPFMRKCMDDGYRTNRKRNVSMWISQQAASDGSQYEEIVQGVFDNTPMRFLFKQPEKDIDWLVEHTTLNHKQATRVTTIGWPDNLSNDPDEAMHEIEQHVGECCLIDGNAVRFFKVEISEQTEGNLVASNKYTLDQLYRLYQNQ